MPFGSGSLSVSASFLQSSFLHRLVSEVKGQNNIGQMGKIPIRLSTCVAECYRSFVHTEEEKCTSLIAFDHAETWMSVMKAIPGYIFRIDDKGIESTFALKRAEPA